ncbi:MAG: bifunctional diaminohydroxyphosphoribosylaminopyrimidine deaminase/5-amino-6-(5-phosphoribosylamino)uracil reductase RibD [Armatimonadota bacterium]
MREGLPEVNEAAKRFMRRALELAERGLGRTSPNPAVGSVVVRDGAIVGEGYHLRAGGPHAERIALAHAGDAASGADIYVTLEPCCHHGRTPPCTDAIIEAGIERVFYAMEDPDPRCAGGGEAALTQAGIEVRSGLLRDEARRMLAGYISHRLTGRPLVTVKLAMSLDGRIATRSGDSQWISGERSRQIVHEMRNRCDAVMVGVGTVLADDPALTTRDVREGRDALRVIVDTRARTPADAQVIHEQSEAGCVIACTASAPPDRVSVLRDAGAEVRVLAERGGHVDLAALMDALGERGVLSVLIEGGGELVAGALEADVVDRMMLFYAPLIIGGRNAIPGVAGIGAQQVADAVRLRDVSTRQVGADMLVTGSVAREAE